MSDSPSPSKSCCCIVYKKKNDGLSTTAKVEDCMELISLFDKLEVKGEQADVTCPLCGLSIKAKQITSQQCENTIDNPQPSTAQESPPIAGKIWNIIIVNQIPVRVNRLRIHREKFISVFSHYGPIKDVYMCDTEPHPPKHEKVARITFNNEEDARKVFIASQSKLIKYEDHVLMITLFSDDYCPIQALPNTTLSKIFLHLSAVRDKFNIESVCKRWESIGRESWSSVYRVENCYESRIWETIISRTQSIREVKMSITDEEEDIKEPEDSIKRLTLIAENLTQLETFAVCVYTMDSSSINTQVRSIISTNKSLKRLGLWWVDLDEGFIDLLHAGIEEIQINYTRRGQRQQRSIQEGPVDLSRFANLQILALFNCTIHKNQLQGIESLENLRVLKLTESKVNPTNLQKIVNFTKLEHLAISNCQIGDVTLSKILQNNKGLKYLDISGIKKITNFSFQHVFQLPLLQVLLMKNLDKVDDKYLISLPKLKILNCNGCSLFTDVGIQRLFTRDSMLEKLYIVDCSITLETLEIASGWASLEDKVFRIVHVSEEMATKWKNSGLEGDSPMSRVEDIKVIISPYQESPFYDPVEDDMQEVFNYFL